MACPVLWGKYLRSRSVWLKRRMQVGSRFRRKGETKMITQPAPRCLVIVPAYNEARSLPGLIEELRAVSQPLDVVVVDDGSLDGSWLVADRLGVVALRNPFNLGIGGAMQTAYKYAVAHGYDIAIQVDGDGQHRPDQIPLLLAPMLAGEADLVVGTRFREETSYRGSWLRRIGIEMFARVVSAMVGQRLTDTTSGFRAANRQVIRLFAAQYPADYPEVETTTLVHRQGLRIVEVPVEMRLREIGESSITIVWSAFYVVKVLLALFVGIFRKPISLPPESVDQPERRVV
jgi:glycosyltransferase involved in cell wall biosynthesis